MNGWRSLHRKLFLCVPLQKILSHMVQGYGFQNVQLCTFPCVCSIDPLQTLLSHMVQGYGFQNVHSFVCWQNGSSLKVLATHGAGIWLPKSALFCVSTMDILHNYLSHIVQGYGFQKVHFFVCLHHGYSSELLVTHGAGIWLPESVPLFSLCLYHGSS